MRGQILPAAHRLSWAGAVCWWLAATGAAAAAPDADAAFYAPPSPLAPAAAGTVIRTRPLANAAALPGAGRNLLVLYHSRDLEGRDAAVSGTVAIPAGTPPEGGWPLISWAHGTTGLAAPCAPSRDTPDGPEHAALSQKQRLLDGYVKRGYVVVATDYQGLGGPGLHPFLQGVIAGRNALDIIRAARRIDAAIGPRYAVMGHSQGGQADLFAAAIAPDYAPELTLLGNVAFAPASHIGDTLTAMTTATNPSLRLGYAIDALQSFASNHAGIDLARILTGPALANLPATRDECITAMLSAGYWATAIPKQQFQPDADLTAALKIAAMNDPAALRIAAPTFIAQGTADDTVLPTWTDAVARALCRSGTPLLYTIRRGADHEQIVDQAAEEAQDWIAARFAGTAAASNCGALPSAAP